MRGGVSARGGPPVVGRAGDVDRVPRVRVLVARQARQGASRRSKTPEGCTRGRGRGSPRRACSGRGRRESACWHLRRTLSGAPEGRRVRGGGISSTSLWGRRERARLRRRRRPASVGWFGRRRRRCHPKRRRSGRAARGGVGMMMMMMMWTGLQCGRLRRGGDMGTKRRVAPCRKRQRRRPG